MSPEQIIVHLRHLLSHTDKCGIFVSEYELRSVFDAYEALRAEHDATVRRASELGHMLMGKVFDRDKDIHELRAKVKDAARYGWLRDPDRLVGACDDHIIVAAAGGEDVLYGQSLDAAIDAEMAKAGTK